MSEYEYSKIMLFLITFISVVFVGLVLVGVRDWLDWRSGMTLKLSTRLRLWWVTRHMRRAMNDRGFEEMKVASSLASELKLIELWESRGWRWHENQSGRGMGEDLIIVFRRPLRTDRQPVTS